jgi:hypothetical protein
MPSRFTCVVVRHRISLFFLRPNGLPLCIWTLRLIPYLVYCEQFISKHGDTAVIGPDLIFFGCIYGSETAGLCGILFLVF